VEVAMGAIIVEFVPTGATHTFKSTIEILKNKNEPMIYKGFHLD